MKKKRSEETETLSAGCSKAEPKNFAPSQIPFRGAGQPKFNQLQTVTYLYLQTKFGEDRSMHAISSYRGNTHKQTGPNTIHCAAASVTS